MGHEHYSVAMNLVTPGIMTIELFGFMLLFVFFLWLVSLVTLSRIRSDKWLRQALTSMNDALVITDRKGRIVKMNAVAERLTGWHAPEAYGKPAQDILKFVDHDSRIAADDPVAQVLKSGKTIRLAKNTVMVARDGTERPIDNNTAPVLTARGRIRGTILIFRDITPRYMAEQKLLESEERLKAVTNEARIGLVMVNRDRCYVYANSFYQGMLGITDKTLVGRRIGDVLPLLYEQIRPNLDRAFAGERVHYEVGGIRKKEQGLNRIYSVTYEPQTRQSLVMHVVIVILDITDIRRNPGSQPPKGTYGTL